MAVAKGRPLPTIIFSLVAVLVHVVLVDSCGVPSSKWCDNEDIARECGVYEACVANAWQGQPEEKMMQLLRTASRDMSRDNANAASPVDVTLYYESLCMGCRMLIHDAFYPAFENVSEIMKITLVPYGWAKEKKEGDHWKFTCQHGPDECKGNLIEACALHHTNNNQTVYFPFIHCFEKNIKKGEVESAAHMCERPGVDVDKVIECSKNDEGNKLLHELAVVTEKLKPKFQYVPWIMFNGVYSKEHETQAWDDMTKLVCDLYKGPKPKGCKKYQL